MYNMMILIVGCYVEGKVLGGREGGGDLSVSFTLSKNSVETIEFS
jgi:hypothetical protein